MIDFASVSAVLIVLACAIGLFASRQPRELRPWCWVAYIEYLACAVAQLVYSRVIIQGGDTLYYGKTGARLAELMSQNFSWAAREVTNLLFQQPSAFDHVAEGAGTNTGSMSAIAAWVTFFCGGSEYGAHFFITGLSLLGACALFAALRPIADGTSPLRLFVAIVLFPSVAFWASAVHKEAFCLFGTGLLFYGWRLLTRRSWLGAFLCVGLGGGTIVLFRTPVLPPLLLGVVLFVTLDRVKKSRGGDALVVGPFYFVLALGVLALGMVVVAHVTPKLGLDKLGETVVLMQQGWALSTDRAGGDLYDVDDIPQLSLAGQLARVPLAMVNALLRPTLLDIRSLGTLMSALEMTVIAGFIAVAIYRRGLKGALAEIQRSPFLMMAVTITLVGCTFVGLVTLNFGSLVRYRVPFLPFYGALVLILAKREVVAERVTRRKPAPRARRPALSAGPIRGGGVPQR